MTAKSTLDHIWAVQASPQLISTACATLMVILCQSHWMFPGLKQYYWCKWRSEQRGHSFSRSHGVRDKKDDSPCWKAAKPAHVMASLLLRRVMQIHWQTKPLKMFVWHLLAGLSMRNIRAALPITCTTDRSFLWHLWCLNQMVNSAIFIFLIVSHSWTRVVLCITLPLFTHWQVHCVTLKHCLMNWFSGTYLLCTYLS